MLCKFIFHKWEHHEAAEYRCKWCGMFKASFGYAETTPYKESVHKIENELPDFLETLDYSKEVSERKRNIDLFEKIVGSDPMQQIDWIIDHSFNKFAHWWDAMESGMIYSPATVKEYVPVTQNNYIRGGRGNKRLISFDHFLATEGQSEFKLRKPYIPYQNELEVSIHGVMQHDYIETSSNDIKFFEGLPKGTPVEVRYLTGVEEIRPSVDIGFTHESPEEKLKFADDYLKEILQ